jgi:di/tricarboxylate transporter
VLVLSGDRQMPRLPLARTALAIMAAVVVVAATGCVRLEGLGRALSLEVVLLVASSVALGRALVVTGAADWIATGVVALAGPLHASWRLAAFMAFSAVLTNLVSNSAAAAVGTPIAIATARSLGQPLEPYVLSVLFGANLSYATPMAYQTNLLVMDAAGYRFADFVRVGAPLVLLMLVTLSYLLSRQYGL